MKPFQFEINAMLARRVSEIGQVVRYAFHDGRRAENPDCKSETVDKKGHEEFNFVPSNANYIVRFTDMVNKTWTEPKPPVILDVGCGFSPILSYLYMVGGADVRLKLKGIDNEQHWCEAMGRFIGFNNVLQDDLLNLSDGGKELIASADYVYSYMPLSKRDLYFKAMKGVWNEMKPGAIITEYYGPLPVIMNLDNKVSSEHSLSFRKP